MDWDPETLSLHYGYESFDGYLLAARTRNTRSLRNTDYYS